jgi:hypothetical protein
VTSSKPFDITALDSLTAGIFNAPTSGDRGARLREWLQTEPSEELMSEVYRELSGRDKGVAKLLKEKLDDIKRLHGQESLATEWAQKAEHLLQASRLNIADALAWQRDAAKAGAPLSREPLAGFKQRLTEVVKGVEDLQHQVMVQREAAVLLAQRIDRWAEHRFGRQQPITMVARVQSGQGCPAHRRQRRAKGVERPGHQNRCCARKRGEQSDCVIRVTAAIGKVHFAGAVREQA